MVGPSRSASTCAGVAARARDGVDAELGELRRAVLRPIPHSASVGRSPITSNQVSVGEPVHAARLAEVGGDLGLELVVADPHRAVQPGALEDRRPHVLANASRVVGLARRGTPRPSRAPRRARRSERSVSMTCADARVVGLVVDRQEHRVGARSRRRCAAACRTRRRSARASYDAVATTPRSVGSPRPPTTTGQPGQLGVAEHLDRGDELVEVDVQHPAARLLRGHRVHTHDAIIAQGTDPGERLPTRVGP